LKKKGAQLSFGKRPMILQKGRLEPAVIEERDVNDPLKGRGCHSHSKNKEADSTLIKGLGASCNLKKD